MLMPRRVKHRKVMRGRMSGLAKGGYMVAFGEYGLATQEPAWITSRQIEAARRAMTRSVKRGGKIWIRIFPDKPATKKPAETRMGSGKGAPDHWVAVVRPGQGMGQAAWASQRMSHGLAAGLHDPRCLGRIGQIGADSVQTIGVEQERLEVRGGIQMAEGFHEGGGADRGQGLGVGGPRAADQGLRHLPYLASRGKTRLG